MEELANVLWIGGPAGAGKTTVGRLLARRHGLRWYNADTRTWVHRDRALATGVTLPPRGPGSAHYDRGPMIIDDLRSLPPAPLILAEGGPVTPALARPRRQAVWLLPSQQVQRARLERRHPEGVPEGYLRSWEIVAGQLREADVAIITVDDQTVDETVNEVGRLFRGLLTAGPTAETTRQRRELIRHGNQALVNQYLSPSAHPKSTGDPRKMIRTFDCECAAPTCVALVDQPVGDAETAVASPPPSLLAIGHTAGSPTDAR